VEGHTISYSYPATTTFRDVEFLYTSTFATIDGVPGYPRTAVYNSPFATLQFLVLEVIFGYPMLQFRGSPGLSAPFSYQPIHSIPVDIEATFNLGPSQFSGSNPIPQS